MQPLEEKHISNPRKDLLPLRQQALYQGSSERLVLFLVRPRYYPYHHINLMIVPQILSQVPLCHLAGFTTCLDGKERPWKTIFRNHWQPASSTALVHRCRFFFRVQDAQHAHSISSVCIQCGCPVCLPTLDPVWILDVHTARRKGRAAWPMRLVGP